MIEPIFELPGLFAQTSSPSSQLVLIQLLIQGLTFGALFALIALGYTMVYGIVELINFAHGDVFMMGMFFALTVLAMLGLAGDGATTAKTSLIITGVVLIFLTVPIFTAGLNFGIDRLIYRPLRSAPKLALIVSAIGVSFMLMNLGQLWNGLLPENGQSVQAASVRSFPNLIPDRNLLPAILGKDTQLRFSVKDAMILGITIPMMILLTLFVKYSKTGKAMRATAQNPTAARLMGINVDSVIGVTFAIGGALAGVGSVMYALYLNSTSFQIGFINGLYAFTAAVLGGIGNIPGAVLGALVIGMVRALGSAYVGEAWTSAMVFLALILILIFRPSGILGARTREKV
ncbi:MAG: branched-chain amino acid ABC transporter permease [Zavarzinella sp.]